MASAYVFSSPEVHVSSHSHGRAIPWRRFFLFQLSPIVGRASRPPRTRGPTSAREWIDARVHASADEDAFEQLFQFGPFPVREDLAVAYSTVEGMMRHLERLLVTFALAPYARKVARPVKRETKVYLYEWSTVEDPAARFENLVALELLARTHLWTESGATEWGLHFVRTRAGKETDFLLTRNRKPWCLLECKLQKTGVESHHRLFASRLGDIPIVQIVKRHGELEAKRRDIVAISASRFLSS